MRARASAVLIAAISGRALAGAARRAGYAALVADFFGDQDTVASAAAHVRLESGLARGIDADELMAALEILAAGREPVGLVCGTGFEDRPDILARLAQRWTLFGNRPETVARLKDPLAFAALCRVHDIPHPDIRATPPPDSAAWLIKRRGGAGGSHVGTADGNATGNVYFQRRVTGTPVSAMIVADGRHAIVLGFSMQWSSPAPHKPYRYGGAVRPAVLPPDTAAALAADARQLAEAIPLVGLNSMDFLVGDEGHWLLEVNPRPGATVDVFEPSEDSLFAMHVAACKGELPDVLPRLPAASAAAIAYAEADISSLPVLIWPRWTADRPHPGTAFRTGDPLCTVRARAATPARARQLVARRLSTVLAWTHPAPP